MENIIKQKAKEFFTNLWVQFEHLEVSQKEENIFLVKVESLDSWKLIWPHGKNLEAITHILKLMILWDLAEDKRVKIYLEVNDYLKSKDERLKDFIISKVKYVERTWKDSCNSGWILKWRYFYKKYLRVKWKKNLYM